MNTELAADRDAQKLAECVRAIPDFPKPGILFRDVTGIFDTAEGFRLSIDLLVKALDGVAFDLIVAPESRGFIFGAALADRLQKAFVPIRKPGKLPRETISENYQLEYGTATIQMHADAVKPGERVVLIDDLLATGGTVVKMVFPLELAGFEARKGALAAYDVVSLVRYPGK